MKLVMVVTKITGNEENDRARALEYCRFAAHKGVLPISSYLNFYNIFMDELGSAVEHLLTLRLAKQVDEIWVFGNEKDEDKRRLIEEACLEYGSRAKYFDAREIGEELLLCTMFSEKLMERLEEMEEC
ncbi:DUF7768 domain-containing protein [Lacrimispora xylanisolvens]|uniref:DUF7768 domain-containing protein n=1 Tax=Lacrimispora xylanisolvens TaxID=384636 RepID=UPI002402B8CD